jgi:hypothetical protein
MTLRAFATDDPRQAGIDGNRRDLRELAGLLHRGEGVVRPSVDGEPWPYERVVRTLGVRTTEERNVRFVLERESEELLVLGDREGLAFVAECLEGLADEGPVGDDWQAEHYEGHPHFAADSCPVVVTLTGDE